MMKRIFIVLSLVFLLVFVFLVPVSADDPDFLDYIPDRPPNGSVPMELYVNDEFANMYRLGASWYGWVEYGRTSSESIWYKNVTAVFDSDTITINGWTNGVHVTQVFTFSQDLFAWVDYNNTPLNHFKLYGNVSPVTWIEHAYTIGFDNGYLLGLDTETFKFSDLASAVIEAPVNVFMEMFQFEVLGVNFSQLAIVAVSLLAVAAVVLFFIRRMK